MAQTKDAHHALVFQVQQRIFNKLCIAYRHSHQNPASSMLAENIKCELAIPEAVYDEALDCFADGAGERVVEVLERDGERYLKLGETAQSNLSDWAGRTNDNQRLYSEAAPRNQRRMVSVAQMAERAR
jgi:hypothetical protein